MVPHCVWANAARNERMIAHIKNVSASTVKVSRGGSDTIEGGKTSHSLSEQFSSYMLIAGDGSPGVIYSIKGNLTPSPVECIYVTAHSLCLGVQKLSGRETDIFVAIARKCFGK